MTVLAELLQFILGLPKQHGLGQAKSIRSQLSLGWGRWIHSSSSPASSVSGEAGEFIPVLPQPALSRARQVSSFQVFSDSAVVGELAEFPFSFISASIVLLYAPSGVVNFSRCFQVLPVSKRREEDCSLLFVWRTVPNYLLPPFFPSTRRRFWWCVRRPSCWSLFASCSF